MKTVVLRVSSALAGLLFAAAWAAAADVPGFELQGTNWTYEQGDLKFDGILMKPEGAGPFPAVLISHGLGGTAESFGGQKAREMVAWGYVCIAPNYTHSAKNLAGMRPGMRPQQMPGAGGPQRPGAGGFPQMRGAGGMPQRPGAGGAPQTPGAGGMPQRPGAGGMPQMPGAGGPPQANNYGASDENLKRAATCLDILVSLPYVDKDRIAAYGHSMGGFVTIGLLSRETERVKAAAISGSGISPRAGYAAPSNDAAEKIKTPLIMFHGALDTTVRPEQSASLKEILDGNKVPNERHVYEGVNHPVDQQKGPEMYALMKKWFEKYLTK